MTATLEAPRQWQNRIVGEGEEDPAQLLANPQNWRIHSGQQQKALGAVLDEVGWVQRVIVNQRTGHVVDGHLRVALAISKGERVPVVYIDVSEDEERLILSTIDPLSAMAGTDEDLLAALRGAMLPEHVDIAALSNVMVSVGGGDEDLIPDETEPEISRAGNRWKLGSNLLLVGDSRQYPDECRDAHLVIFDPPFDVDYSEWKLPPSPVLAVWGRGDRRIKWEATCIIPAGYMLHELIITGGVRGQPRPELPCLVHDSIHVWRKRWWHDGGHPIDADLVREIDWPRTVDDRHYSHKPKCGGVLTGLMSWGKPVIAMEVLLAYGPSGSLVYDPCAGSGSSLIAAHRHGRRWIGFENQPKWADLIVKRWEKETGIPAQLDDADEK